jgi:hypothetical protein
VRWVTVIVAAIIVTLACWQDPSYARGGGTPAVAAGR